MVTSQTCPQSEQDAVLFNAEEGFTIVRGERHFGQGQRTTWETESAAIGVTSRQWSACARGLFNEASADGQERQESTFILSCGFCE
jgi:hypothetical protein